MTATPRLAVDPREPSPRVDGAPTPAPAPGSHLTSPEVVERDGGGPRVVGVDVSLTGTGLASSLGWHDVIGVDDLTTLPLPRRQQELWALGFILLEHIGRPNLVVIETPAYSRSGAGMSERCGLWWRLVHYLIQRNVSVAEVTPTCRLRYALGKGVGKKTAIVDAAARRFPQYATNGNDNACDAIWLMAMGRDHLGYPLAKLPQTHRKALDSVQWPEMTE